MQAVNFGHNQGLVVPEIDMTLEGGGWDKWVTGEGVDFDYGMKPSAWCFHELVGRLGANVSVSKVEGIVDCKIQLVSPSVAIK